MLSRGLSELHLGSPLSPFMEAMPRLFLFASRFKHQVFSLPCPPPILSPMEPSAGAAWRGSWRAVPLQVFALLRSESLRQPASPTWSGLGPLPWGSRLCKALGVAVVFGENEDGSPQTQKAERHQNSGGSSPPSILTCPGSVCRAQPVQCLKEGEILAITEQGKTSNEV